MGSSATAPRAVGPSAMTNVLTSPSTEPTAPSRELRGGGKERRRVLNALCQAWSRWAVHHRTRTSALLNSSNPQSIPGAPCGAEDSTVRLGDPAAISTAAAAAAGAFNLLVCLLLRLRVGLTRAAALCRCAEVQAGLPAAGRQRQQAAGRRRCWPSGAPPAAHCNCWRQAWSGSWACRNRAGLHRRTARGPT